MFPRFLAYEAKKAATLRPRLLLLWREAEKKTLYQLIDRIEVYETEGTGKNRTQQVVIFWKFVGYIELPEYFSQKNYKADTRQGVAVEYPTIVLPA